MSKCVSSLQKGVVDETSWTNDKIEFWASHKQEQFVLHQPKILPSILHHIGNTPLVRLNRIGKEDGLQCELLVKCEYFNAGGSIKDRIGLRMVEEAERDGRLKPGMTLIEPTSGNTGIALALVAAIKGYRCIIVVPEKNSQEKMNTLNALGAEIVRTPNGAKSGSPESPDCVARRLQKDIPNSIILDQFGNSCNPRTHYEQTAEEILDQCDGTVDMIVAGAGTGGTITGIGRKLKERCPDCVVVGVDPIGSRLADPNQAETSFYEVEGVGGDSVPGVLDRKVVDYWVKTNDKDSLLTARRLIREEGLLCGGSGGASVWAALQAAKKLKSGQRCVIILPDGVRNYMSKLLDDNWMADRDFIDVDIDRPLTAWWWNLTLSHLKLHSSLAVSSSLTVQSVIDIMEKQGHYQLAVIGKNGDMAGVITQSGLMSNMLAGKISPDTKIELVLHERFKKINLHTTLGKVSRILKTEQFALVVHEQQQIIQPGQVSTKEITVGIVTPIDLLNFVSNRQKAEQSGLRRG